MGEGVGDLVGGCVLRWRRCGTMNGAHGKKVSECLVLSRWCCDSGSEVEGFGLAGLSCLCVEGLKGWPETVVPPDEDSQVLAGLLPNQFKLFLHKPVDELLDAVEPVPRVEGGGFWSPSAPEFCEVHLESNRRHERPVQVHVACRSHVQPRTHVWCVDSVEVPREK